MRQEPTWIGALSPRKRTAVTSDLRDEAGSLVTVNTIADWADTPIPAESSAFRGNVSWKELTEEIRLHNEAFPEADSQDSIYRALALYAGVAPVDEVAQRHFALDAGHGHLTTFPTTRVSLPHRPATIRGVPPGWNNDPVKRTPVIATGDGSDHLQLWFDDGMSRRPLMRVKILEPMTLYPLAYGNSRSGSSITINPLQQCPMRCTFCRRGYHRLDTQEFVNLNPEETANLLITKYGTRFPFRQIRIITGAFATFETLQVYLQQLTATLARLTHGQFDPVQHEDQSLHILTHLARTRPHLQTLRQLGVKMMEDSVEIIDDKRRRVIMPKASPKMKITGKGDQPFAEILPAVTNGVDIFGPGNYGVTVIVGLDDAITTQHGFEQLQQAGLASITTALFVPYGLEEITLQQMGLSEVLAARRYARLNFQRAA